MSGHFPPVTRMNGAKYPLIWHFAPLAQNGVCDILLK